MKPTRVPTEAPIGGDGGGDRSTKASMKVTKPTTHRSQLIAEEATRTTAEWTPSRRAPA